MPALGRYAYELEPSCRDTSRKEGIEQRLQGRDEQRQYVYVV